MKAKWLIITATLFLLSCDKQGPAGPTGPAGVAGTKGATGAAGPAGPQGTSGNNNIKTLIDSISASTWKTGMGGYYASFTDFNITVADSENVSVSVATTNTSNASWFTLTYANFLSTGDEMQFSYSEYQVTLVYNYASAPTQKIYVKVTVIPSSIIKRKTANGSGKSVNN
jgi:hypothetical protein